MKTQLWSKSEVRCLLQRHGNGQPAAEIASVLGRTEASVRYKLLNLGYSTRRIAQSDLRGNHDDRLDDGSECQIDEDVLKEKAEQNLSRLESRRELRALEQDYRSDLLEERILEEFRGKLNDLPPKIDIPPVTSTFRETVSDDDAAVLIISDSHVGQVVDIRETEAPTAYNPAVFLARLLHLESESIRILQSHPVRELVILFGGDIVHGRLGHSLEDDLTIPIATQVDLALHTFFSFIVRMAGLARTVTIHGVGGNHGRWPGTRKVPTDRRWSQLDTLVYQALQALIDQTLTNVTFDNRIAARRLVDVEDFRMLLLHGDQLRGGPCAANGIGKEMQHWLMRCAQSGQRPPDLIVCGDKHISANLPVGLGRAIINGSFVGEDVFSQNFQPSPPTQTLFFIRRGVGLVETHLIRLDHAELNLPLAYELKPYLQQLVLSHASATKPTQP